MKKNITLIMILLCFGCNKIKPTFSERDYYCGVMITKDNKEIIKKLSTEKYFICQNLDKYLSYNTLNDLNYTDIVSEINSGLYRDYYQDIIASDLSKDNVVLVNKYNVLDKEYIPSDLESISSEYSIGLNNKLRHEARINFENMCYEAKKDNIILYNVSAYRDFKYQEKIYNKYVEKKGIEIADKVSARPGSSEHQSGLTVDINTPNISFLYTKEYEWLKNNSYKYGFIIRYPKDKKIITGYNYEPWHYRYVGKEAAKIIYEDNITFEEYYAYYVNN